MFRSKGKLVFDHLKHTKHFEPWWAMVICDRELQRYYAWHLLRYGKVANTASPWGAHISVIKGESAVDKSKWKLYHGTIIDFEYDAEGIDWNDNHAWVNVYCKQLSELRVELGLAYRPRFHLTIGRFDV